MDNSWLDDFKAINDDIGEPIRSMGTRVVWLDISTDYKVGAIPQWLDTNSVHVERYMPVLGTPNGNIMLTKSIANTVEDALKSAIYYRRGQLISQLKEFDAAFFSDDS